MIFTQLTARVKNFLVGWLLGFCSCSYFSSLQKPHNWRTVAIRKIKLKLHNQTTFLTHSTHSICGCQRLATFALLAPPAGKNYNVLNGPNISEQNDILVGIMAAIILILAIVVVAILSCYCRKRKVSH